MGNETYKPPMSTGTKVFLVIVIILLLGAAFGSHGGEKSERCYHFDTYNATACTDDAGHTTYK